MSVSYTHLDVYKRQKLEWKDMTAEIVRAAADKFRPLYQKKKPQKFLEQWMEELGLSDSPAMQKLLQMTVFYKTMPEFLAAVSYTHLCGRRPPVFLSPA